MIDELMTLPEVLRSHGFVTGGFTSNPVVDRLETRRGNRAVVNVDISVDGGPVATVRHEALVSLTPTVL